MSSTLAIIANPHAHRNRLWPQAAQALRAAAPGAPLYETGSAEELSRAAARIAGERPRVLAIAGGDGTVQHTLTALHQALGGDLPPLALLGGGALDSLASLGGSGSAEVRLRRLAETLHAGTPLTTTDRDTLLAQGQVGFRLGLGLPERFLRALYQSGHSSRLRGALLVLRALASSVTGGPLARELYEPLRSSVALDGDEWPQLPLFGVLCASVAEAGLGLRPFRRATEQPGFFQVLGLTARPRKFATELPRLCLGRPARRDRLLDNVAERVEIRGAPFAFFVDGELHDCAGELTISVGPRVRLVHA